MHIQFAALAALIITVAAAPAQAQFGPQGPPAVGVTPAELRPITESTEFVGRVEAVSRVDIRARVTGFLQEQLFREGQEVQAGEILYRLERAPFEAEVERARAQVAAAEAEVTNARTALNRARTLVASSAGTQARVDEALAAERTATAQLLGAQAQVRAAQINLGYTEIAGAHHGQDRRSTYSVGNVVSPTRSRSPPSSARTRCGSSSPSASAPRSSCATGTRAAAARRPCRCASPSATAEPTRRPGGSTSSTPRSTATPTPSWCAP
jgi:multidrug efflux pump subunit AcrA (membrane-fusion protein)